MVDPQFVEEIRTLARERSKIEAIKIYRERTGSGLADAKNAVEAIVAGQNPKHFVASGAAAPSSVLTPPVTPGDPRSDPRVLALLADGRKIEAIKRVREISGLGLAEAKNLVEAMAVGAPSQPYPPSHAATPAPVASPQKAPAISFASERPAVASTYTPKPRRAFSDSPSTNAGSGAAIGWFVVALAGLLVASGGLVFWLFAR